MLSDNSLQPEIHSQDVPIVIQLTSDSSLSERDLGCEQRHLRVAPLKDTCDSVFWEEWKTGPDLIVKGKHCPRAVGEAGFCCRSGGLSAGVSHSGFFEF